MNPDVLSQCLPSLIMIIFAFQTHKPNHMFLVRVLPIFQYLESLGLSRHRHK